MRQLIYISTVRGSQSDNGLAQLLAVSRMNNRQDDVTGLLLYNGNRFLQVLEGSDLALTHTYERIATDERHRSLVLLSDREIDDREFGDWSMAFEQDSAGADFADLAGQVERAVVQASPNTKALFESFAKAA
ncbi:BLUF domain-containing protein [Pacificimonas sp. ICDLI1SI03]